MAKCSFCGYAIKPGTGLIFVLDTGSTLNFCSSKCRKSLLKLKRSPLKTKWTFAARSLRKSKSK